MVTSSDFAWLDCFRGVDPLEGTIYIIGRNLEVGGNMML